MKTLVVKLLAVVLAACFATSALAVADICSICGKPIEENLYLATDKVTGIKQKVCSKCLELPSCFICGLPVNDTGIELPDGRHLCARDAKTAVTNAGDAQQIAGEIRDQLDRLFSRFTSFPTNVDVTVLDRIDVDKMFQPGGNDFESPNLLGCLETKTNAAQTRCQMRLLTGLPLVELKATVAHEFTHAWVGENVPKERRKRLSRNAEEGFCELVAYLLMDSQGEDAQKKFILKNHYTRGQVELFIAAEQEYQFDQVLDWIQYGETSELKPGQLEEIRDVKMPKPSVRVTVQPVAHTNSPTNAVVAKPTTVLVKTADTFRLQGIMWGTKPAAIINGHTVVAHDRFKVSINGRDIEIRCLEIQQGSVRIENLDSGKQQVLHL